MQEIRLRYDVRDGAPSAVARRADPDPLRHGKLWEPWPALGSVIKYGQPRDGQQERRGRGDDNRARIIGQSSGEDRLHSTADAEPLAPP